MKKLARFGEPVSNCVWAPDGQSFVTGCLDKERNMCQWNINGELIYDWGRSHRIQDLALSPNGRFLVAMEHDFKIHVYNFITREPEYEIDMKCKMGSVAISQNSRFLLVNKLDGEARMLDLETRETVRSFRNGEKGDLFAIRAYFGGANESFVVTGSLSMRTPQQHRFRLTISNRWPYLHLAQGERATSREAQRPRKGMCQFCRMEFGSMSICLRW